MKILILPSWYPKNHTDVGGVFFRDQALALKAYGHDVGVISVNSRSILTLGKPYSQPSPFELDEGVPTYRSTVWAALPRVPYGNFLLWRRKARKLFRDYLTEHGKPEVIHAHSALFAGAVAAELGAEHDIPVVLTEHSSGFHRGLYRPWQLKLAARAADGAACRIAVSTELGAWLSRQLDAVEKEWIWVPNVVASRFGDAEPVLPESGDRPLRFLNLALMTENKGQLDLLRAFATAFPSGETELWLGGDGRLRDLLVREAKALGVGDRVHFLGMVTPERVPALLRRIDVMVVASHYETFGVVAAEALMAGRPVVATRCGGPECIVGEGDGALVPVKSPEAMAAALVRIADNLDQYPAEDLTRGARERFSGQAVSRQLTRIYEAVVESCPAGSECE